MAKVLRDRRIVPTIEKLATNRTNLLRTALGPLDVLSSINGESYADLLCATKTKQVGKLPLRVLKLSKVVESKELANRDKDKAMLPVMRKTLEIKTQETIVTRPGYTVALPRSGSGITAEHGR